MPPDADALVIGGGPAGSTAAALLARAGWHVVLAERTAFPRDAVCGECLSIGALDWLDALGVGAQVRREAGPPLRSVGWLDGRRALHAPLPVARGRHPHGRALGRARLDALLLGHARALGAEVRQPARVCKVSGEPGDYHCELLEQGPEGARRSIRQATVVIDARGSVIAQDGPRSGDDLLAFKSRWRDARLAPGHLPLLSFRGGYGGVVLAEDGWTTLAACVQRARLQDCRALAPGLAAGAALEAWLRRACPALGALLDGATRAGPWLACGSVRPGMRVASPDAPLRIGNAAGESHPLAGEGIAMAIQSAALLATRLARLGPRAFRGGATALGADYARAWRRTFRPRLLAAAACARVAMHPGLAQPAGALLATWPALLGVAARGVGKTRAALPVPPAPGWPAARGVAADDDDAPHRRSTT